MIELARTQRRELAEQRIKQRELLNQVDQHEHEQLVALVEQALASTSEDRWQTYETLKRQVDSFVGWGARNEKLSTSAHYCAMIELIDWLLAPSPSDVAQPTGGYLREVKFDSLDSLLGEE